MELQQPVRLMGVSISNLAHQAEQLPLFENERRKAFATQAMDEVNGKFGEMTVTFGSLLPDKDKRGSFLISPAWRPSGIRNVGVK